MLIAMQLDFRNSEYLTCALYEHASLHTQHRNELISTIYNHAQIEMQYMVSLHGVSTHHHRITEYDAEFAHINTKTAISQRMRQWLDADLALT